MAVPTSTNEAVEAIEENGVCGDGIKGYLEPRFECPICLTWLRDPILTSCGHKFCSHCIYTWLQREGACCPVDSKPLKAESDLFRDLYTSREISQQRTTCPYRRFGCAVELSPIEMETHASQCAHRRTLPDIEGPKCPFKVVGCAESPQTEEALRRHLEEGINSHLTMIANALPRLSGANNDSKPVEFKVHSAVSAESKLWDPPPKNGTGSTTEESPTDWQQLLKNLYERIVVLEQQNRELSIAVSNQKNQLTTLQTLTRFNQEEAYLRNCNGVYVWRLRSFGEKLAAMTSDPLKMFYSPGFYTGPSGYKICARINVSCRDPEHLSLVLHVMRSENDDALDWPFDGTMRFVLVHPSDPAKHIREVTSSRPDIEAFRRPTCELNKRSFGYTEFVRVHDLPEFLHDDCLTFRLDVRARDAPRTPDLRE